MVISTEPEAGDWDAMEEAAGIPLRHSGSSYWAHRLDYDEGRIDSRQYWSLVLGRQVGLGRASAMDSLDAIQWSHLNLETLDVLELLHSRGARLAVLSTMPPAMAAEFAAAPWTKYFSQLFFSSRIGLTKPEPGVFKHVLAALETDPADLVFTDDKHENVHAARTLGINAIHHTPGTDLQRELGL
ncbi:HAD family phosphatase [Arthrobacter deserti]|uniref:HAD family phosphatase n=1 Tax=Arthrobacter deserti TaxID=1742687 RepID=A0ABX1JM20_9MICC|nr:HAD family phosphatase [Arthrobacter deserti]